ncbi:MAG TPA: hypothetical protein VHP37_13345 [Burkholderiales bacterium]|nr:hypothetical protein [Burkholderiales bacterium]
MARFWLGTWDVQPVLPASRSPAQPIAYHGASRLAIEVIVDDGDGGAPSYAVLLSSVDDVADPQNLECRIGFANDAKACAIWRDRGFPLVDAAITYDGTTLEVFSPFYGGTESMTYDQRLLSITGLEFASAAGSKAKLGTRYRQFYQGPDWSDAANYIRQAPVQWGAPRTQIAYAQSQATLTLDVVRGVRSPDLIPLVGMKSIGVAHAWSGYVDVAKAKAAANAEQPTRVRRADLFGVPAFRFEDVEVLGFRLDLPNTAETDACLSKLVEPLNFHLADRVRGARVPDFRYRAATRTVLVELLRYGRMKLRAQDPPLTLMDYQSQHELVVRVLVGRVDDDTAQAHDPAVFVPAIFVDNPWSKIVGRDLQGFGKCMASFCVQRDNAMVPLRPNGRAADAPDPYRLGDVIQISTLTRSVTGGAPDGKKLVTIDCRPDDHPDWDDFRSIDLDIALGSFSAVDARWRQTDFDGVEFRRAFAREAVAEPLRGFKSVQVAPIGKRGRNLTKTWVTSRFEIDGDVRVAFPTGGARVTFHADPAAPRDWLSVCKLFGVGDEPLTQRNFRTGSWYRMMFSMDMTVESGLAWNDAG